MSGMENFKEIDFNIDRRKEIARRSLKRELEGRMSKLTTGIFGVLGYFSFIYGVSVIYGLATYGAPALKVALIIFPLSLLYAFTAYRLWFTNRISPWLLVAPPIISIALAIISWRINLFSLLLNSGVLIALPFYLRTRDSLAKLDQAVAPDFKFNDAKSLP
jgi:hypothetical protein